MKKSDIRFMLCVSLFAVSVICINYCINNVNKSLVSIDHKLEKHKKIKESKLTENK